MNAFPTLADAGTAIARVIAVLETGLRRTVEYAATSRRRRMTIRTISGLGDHLLTDVGLHRYQIDATVDRFSGPPLAGDPTAAQVGHGSQLRDTGCGNGPRYGFGANPHLAVRRAKETPA